jgi:hypothetical protein
MHLGTILYLCTGPRRIHTDRYRTILNLCTGLGLQQTLTFRYIFLINILFCTGLRRLAMLTVFVLGHFIDTVV